MFLNPSPGIYKIAALFMLFSQSVTCSLDKKTEIHSHDCNRYLYDLTEDTMQVKQHELPYKEHEIPKLNKRQVVSEITKVFDPLQYFAPLYLEGKIILRQLSDHTIKWTDLAKEEIVIKMIQYRKRIDSTILKFKRHIDFKKNEEVELTVFTDASEIAYGACIYLKTKKEDHKGQFKVHLLIAKQRIAPKTNPLTIPRLELLGIAVGVRLLKYTLKKMQLNAKNIDIFSDSTIALAQIKNQSSPKGEKQPIFVENRTREIWNTLQDLKKEDESRNINLAHVFTDQNPADHITRGCYTLKELVKTNFLNGTVWMSDNQHKDHPYNISENKITVPVPVDDIPNIEKSNAVKTLVVKSKKQTILENEVIPLARINKLNRTMRITAFVLRYIKHKVYDKLSKETKQKLDKKIPELQRIPKCNGWLTLAEINTSENLLIRINQQTYKITAKPKQNQILLNTEKPDLIIYQHHRAHNITNKPIIHTKSELARQIIQKVHSENIHAGPATTLGIILEKYAGSKWRAAVKKELKKCFKCRRYNNHSFRLAHPGYIPERRTTECVAFTHTGVDFLGPIITQRNSSAEQEKAYIALFTCATTRLVHLELVRNLSTDEFLLALSRFMNRRGYPKTITSDNAATFKLTAEILEKYTTRANEEILELPMKTITSYQEKDQFRKTQNIERAMTRIGVKWYFNTALAPWQGGFFERLVGLVKKALKHAIGDEKYITKDLETVMIECENLVNRRPITYIDEDSEDVKLLRPIDLITPQIQFPSFDEDGMNDEYAVYTTNFREVKEHVKRFWQVFYRDYLNQNKNFRSIQQSNKAYSNLVKPIIGEVVLLKDDKAPRQKWKVGVITELIEGRDGEIRSVRVKTTLKKKKRDGDPTYKQVKTQIVTRPLQLVIPLEIRPTTEKEVVEKIENNLSSPARQAKAKLVKTRPNRVPLSWYKLLVMSILALCLFAFAPIEANKLDRYTMNYTTNPTSTTTEIPFTTPVETTTKRKAKTTTSTTPSTTSTSTETITTTAIRSTTSTVRSTTPQTTTRPTTTTTEEKTSTRRLTTPETTTRIVTTTVEPKTSTSKLTTTRTTTNPPTTTLELTTSTTETIVPEVVEDTIPEVVENISEHDLVNDYHPGLQKIVHANYPKQEGQKRAATTPKPKTTTSTSTSTSTTTTATKKSVEFFGSHDSKSRIECTQRGANLIEEDEVANKTNSVCTENWCDHSVITKQKVTEILIPPEFTLHKHTITWKKPLGNKHVVIEKSCPATDFCWKSVKYFNCFLCTRFLFNPQCHPKLMIGLVILLLALPFKIILCLCHIGDMWKMNVAIVRRIANLFGCCKNSNNQEEIEMRPLRKQNNSKLPAIRNWRDRIRNRTGRNRHRQNRTKTLEKPRTRTYEVTTVDREGIQTFDVNQTGSRTPTPPITVLAITIFCLLASSVIADTCDESYPISHDQVTCNEQNICRIERTEDLFFTPTVKTICLQIVSEKKVIAKFKLTVSHNFRKCQKGPIMYTKNVTVHADSSKRCHGMGECVDRKCLDVGPNSKLNEFPEGNKYPGHTYCTSSCGGIWCKCLLPTEACLFYRTYAVPTTDDKFEIYSCETWSNAINFQAVVNIDNREIEEVFIVQEGEDHKFKYRVGKKDQYIDVKIKLLDASGESGLSILGKKFIQSNEKIALAAITNEIFPLECTETGECNYRETCNCNAAEAEAICECKVPDLYKIVEDKHHNLPVITERYHLSTTPDNIPTIKMKHNKLHVQLVMEQSYHSTVIESKIDCTIPKTTPYTGCYNCLKGASQNITCTSPEPTHAKLSCDNNEFIDVLTCDKKGIVNVIHRKFNSSSPKGECSVLCGEKNHTFKIDGKLIYVSHTTLIEYLNEVLHSEKSISDIHPWHVPDVWNIVNTISKGLVQIVSALFALAVTALVLYLCCIPTCLRLIVGERRR
ncbi:hypothetical protein B9Z55_015517 [Caenorhabditis nigoni]|uniref:Integrase catalytic domain-containing protein n=1 Tax=Caenorhabditis nigoni TaxID=1611254 RepID=A0A2G5UAV9_9PELO|nr:hypothetical protein B9Z55_015517 [Caenorhabditis nigoni]